MTGKGILVLIVALAGIVAPFIVASRILNSVYDPTVRGAAPPLPPQIWAYSVASLVAVMVFGLAVWKLRRLTQSVPSASLPQDDELPY